MIEKSSFVFLKKNFSYISVFSTERKRHDLVTKAILGMRKSSEGRGEKTERKGRGREGMRVKGYTDTERENHSSLCTTFYNVNSQKFQNCVWAKQLSNKKGTIGDRQLEDSTWGGVTPMPLGGR